MSSADTPRFLPQLITDADRGGGAGPTGRAGGEARRLPRPGTRVRCPRIPSTSHTVTWFARAHRADRPASDRCSRRTLHPRRGGRPAGRRRESPRPGRSCAHLAGSRRHSALNPRRRILGRARCACRCVKHPRPTSAGRAGLRSLSPKRPPPNSPAPPQLQARRTDQAVKWRWKIAIISAAEMSPRAARCQVWGQIRSTYGPKPGWNQGSFDQFARDSNEARYSGWVE